MATQEDVDRVIEQIYDAALDSTRWPLLLGSIARLLGGHAAAFVLIGRQTTISFDYNCNPESVAAYNGPFRDFDPWLAPEVKPSERVVATGQELVPTPVFEKSDYYEAALKPSEIYDCVGVCLDVVDGLTSAISIHRAKKRPVFDDREKQLLRTLEPHLRRLVKITRRFEERDGADILYAGALDRLSFGALLLDQRAQLVFANHAAEQILARADGLTLRNRRLSAVIHEDSRALERSLAAALPKGRSAPACGRGSSFVVRRRNAVRPYVLQVTPLPERTGARTSLFGRPAPGVLVAVVDTEDLAPSLVGAFGAAFGLTQTESTLAAHLHQGLSLREAADKMLVTRETVRWHLRNIMAKTDLRRQGDLLRLLASLSLPLR